MNKDCRKIKTEMYQGYSPLTHNYPVSTILVIRKLVKPTVESLVRVEPGNWLQGFHRLEEPWLEL